jgi:hypothetical protein
MKLSLWASRVVDTVQIVPYMFDLNARAAMSQPMHISGLKVGHGVSVAATIPRALANLALISLPAKRAS